MVFYVLKPLLSYHKLIYFDSNNDGYIKVFFILTLLISCITIFYHLVFILHLIEAFVKKNINVETLLIRMVIIFSILDCFLLFLDVKMLLYENNNGTKIIESIDPVQWNNHIQNQSQNQNNSFYNLKNIQKYQSILGCCGYSEPYKDCMDDPNPSLKLCKTVLKSSLSNQPIYISNTIGIGISILNYFILLIYKIVKSTSKSTDPITIKLMSD
ncbi:expressed protein [Dictyostelium purpureum]|uniref:Expressed protein n=1 Tax=Dictyostelium purpureum TaxID=5786 RepID=F0ZI40_DICPU|nr:uncharacterized protein DICPUDRAFT_91841 [Dictyostelium purpureum]EGC36394.1 expressed protein [Dictyostelium purpureum]|eukprot:XP_003287091.1 expressed protein [Dictyostelium purpureum]